MMMDDNSVVFDDNGQQGDTPSCSKTNKTLLDVSARKLKGKEIIVDNPGTENEVDGYKIIHSSTLLSMINTCSKCTYCGVENNFTVEQSEKKEKAYARY